jgi:hypothetical protein
VRARLGAQPVARCADFSCRLDFLPANCFSLSSIRSEFFHRSRVSPRSVILLVELLELTGF